MGIMVPSPLLDLTTFLRVDVLCSGHWDEAGGENVCMWAGGAGVVQAPLRGGGGVRERGSWSIFQSMICPHPCRIIIFGEKTFPDEFFEGEVQGGGGLPPSPRN